MALAANVARDPKKSKPFRFDQFNPYAKRDAKRNRGDQPRQAVKLDAEQSVKAVANVFGGKVREKGSR